MKLPLALIAVIAAGTAATAVAQTGGGPSEPGITAASVLRLTPSRSCVRPARVTVRALPPAGVELDLVRVAVDGVLAARIEDVPHSASITIRIPQGSSRLRVTVRSAGGQEIHADRRYRACAPAPPPPRSTPGHIITRGGGED
jgi:hypothetical protein